MSAEVGNPYCWFSHTKAQKHAEDIPEHVLLPTFTSVLIAALRAWFTKPYSNADFSETKTELNKMSGARSHYTIYLEIYTTKFNHDIHFIVGF